jgi:hypothetical protein
MILTFNIKDMTPSELIFLKEVILNEDFFNTFTEYEKIIINDE